MQTAAAIALAVPLSLFALACAYGFYVLLDVGRRWVATKDRQRDWEHERLHAVERDTRDKLKLFDQALGRTAQDLGSRISDLEAERDASKIAGKMGARKPTFQMPG